MGPSRQIGVSKNRGKHPKMDGENHGKPYEQMDDLGGKPPLFWNIQMLLYNEDLLSDTVVNPSLQAAGGKVAEPWTCEPWSHCTYVIRMTWGCYYRYLIRSIHIIKYHVSIPRWNFEPWYVWLPLGELWWSIAWKSPFYKNIKRIWSFYGCLLRNAMLFLEAKLESIVI